MTNNDNLDTEMPIETLKLFAKYIADNNLWDEVEQHLKSQGHKKIRMSVNWVKAIGRMLRQKAEADIRLGKHQNPVPDCPVVCNPRPIDDPPPDGGGDGGGNDPTEPPPTDD